MGFCDLFAFAGIVLLKIRHDTAGKIEPTEDRLGILVEVFEVKEALNLRCLGHFEWRLTGFHNELCHF